MTGAGLHKPESGAIRVLVADDSSFMRKALTHILKFSIRLRTS